jgi:hypothetical protein
VKVSIVAGYNSKVEMTIDFLDNLQEYCSRFEGDVEMILVNGGNPFDITHPFVTKLIRTDKTYTTGVYNEGLRAISEDSDFVLLTGNDSFPKDYDWLDRLVIHYRDPITILCPENDRPGRVAYGHLYQKEDANLFYCNMFPSVVWFFRASLLKDVGYFDENYIRTGMYNDDDYCMRIQLKYGPLTVGVLKGLVIPHLCGQESGNTGTLNEDMQINYKYFKEKYK